MNFNAPLVKTIRFILFPVSLLYWLVIWVRNRLFDLGIIRSVSFKLPIICVGNLVAGGSGKSTMIEFLCNSLRQNYRLAVLSRGYKRKTRGYAIAGPDSTALEIGDEPMQFYRKFPDTAIAVGEERVVAVAQLLHDRPETELILLDDAFQHRHLKAGLNILLTEYSNLYTRDWYLPTGDLRDEKKSVERAHIVIVTKCPDNLSGEEAAAIKVELSLRSDQQLFFATLHYGYPYHILSGERRKLDAATEALLLSGIANPEPLKQYLEQRIAFYEEMRYSDHHIFSIDDWKEIRRRFAQMKKSDSMILTTEKDAVRLVKFGKELEAIPMYVIPVEMKWLFDQQAEFVNTVKAFIGHFERA